MIRFFEESSEFLKNKLFLLYKGGLKISYGDIISNVDEVFDQWDPSSATPMEEVHWP